MLSLTTRRWISAGCVVSNCLTAGSIFTFPLLSAPLGSTLHLSSTQLSTLATSAILAQYGFAPLVGNLVDKRGPGAASFAASALFALGYGMLGWRFKASVEMENGGSDLPELQWLWLCAYYGLAGAATAGSYFSAIIASTKSFPPRHAGLAIGIPCAVFGLSPLFLSTLAPLFTVSPSGSETVEGVTEELDPGRWLLFLAALLGIVNLIGGFGLRTIPWEETPADVLPKAVARRDELSPTRPPGWDSGFGSSEASSVCEVEGQPNERTPLVPRADQEPQPEQSLAQLLKTPPFWLFGLVFLLSTGPCEMIMASLGGVIESLLGVHINSSSVKIPLQVLAAFVGTPVDGRGLALRRFHVQILSATNTCSRLIVGALSDYLSSRFSISRLYFLGGATIALAITFVFSALTLDTASGLWTLSIAVGLSYGTLFTTAPSVVRSLWPESFGLTWGLISWFSAFGAAIFTPLFGVMADAVAHRQASEVAYGREAFEGVFLLSGGSCLLALVLTVVLWRVWWRGLV